MTPAAEPGVSLNCFEQILCAPVVQEKESLPETRQGCRAEFITRSIALADIVGQPRPHIVEYEIGIQIDVLVP